MSTPLAIPTPVLELAASKFVRALADIQIPDPRTVSIDRLLVTIEQADQLARAADDHERKVEASQRPGVADAYALHQRLLAELNRLKGTATKLKADAKALGWACNQELTRRREDAERINEQERQRLQAIEDERAERDNARLRKEADDARITSAVILAESGDTIAATKLLEQPADVVRVAPVPVFVPSVIVPETPDTGTSFGKLWNDFTVTNEALIPREYLMIDAVKIKKVVGALRENTRIPGIIPKWTATTRLGRR